MKHTMREHLAETLPLGKDAYRHEEITWAIHDWLSCHGMEWTYDDRKAVQEWGENPTDYMDFEEEQRSRIEEIYDAAQELIDLMIKPIPGRTLPEQKLEAGDFYQMVEDFAKVISDAGYTVYFPTHVETDDGEYITDEWEGN